MRDRRHAGQRAAEHPPRAAGQPFRDIHGVLNDVSDDAVFSGDRGVNGRPELLDEAAARLRDVVLDDRHLMRLAGGERMPKRDLKRPLLHRSGCVGVLRKRLENTDRQYRSASAA